MKFLNVEFSVDNCIDGKIAPTSSMQILTRLLSNIADFVNKQEWSLYIAY